MKITTHSAEETIALGKRIAEFLKGGDVVAFEGDLGAGKTTITRGICLGLGLPDNVTSPTFSLVNEYRGEKNTLAHFDMYRIESSEDLYLTGFYDYIEEGCVVAVEWSENIKDALPEGAITVRLERLDDNTRIIEISGDERFDAAWD